MGVKTYQGSCHCGAVRFEADLDLSQGSGRCNCSICTKARKWGMIVKPPAFRLLAGQDALADYSFASKSAHHQFCKTCGVHTCGYGNIPEIGGAFVSVSVHCLDNVTPEELASIPVKYSDGRNNNWWNEPAETRYL
jgi:hypothetical protein